MSARKGKYSLIYSSKKNESFKDDKFLQFLFIIYLAVFTILSLKPENISEWWYESTATIFIIGILIVLYRSFRLSNLSYVCAAFFMVLHSLGAHYTYSQCPVGDWLNELIGADRNNYDRLVGFAFGYLISLPIMEILFRSVRLKYTEACVMAVVVNIALYSLASVAKMLLSMMMNDYQAEVFLAVQGDSWDLQKDILVSMCGSVTSMVSCILKRKKNNKKIHIIAGRNR